MKLQWPLSAFGLAYANFEDNGYVRCTITPEKWTTEFVVVDTIGEPESAAKVDATMWFPDYVPFVPAD